VCLLVWSDHEGQRELPDRSIYEELFNSDGTSDIIPSGSVKKWFETSSYGGFSIEATVADWVVTVNTEAFYSSPNRGRTDNIIPGFAPALQALDDSGFDFPKFDADGDGIIDMVVFVHSGYDGQQDGPDQFGVPADLRIAPHARPACTASTCWTSSDGAYQLGPYAVASGYMGLLNFDPARIGIVTHEMIHW
jgi:M6 family metalloprotease-like protein